MDNVPKTNGLFSELTAEECAECDFSATVSGVLFDERKRRNMTREEFAEFMHTSPETVEKWESLDCIFKIECSDTTKMRIVCDYLGVDEETCDLFKDASNAYGADNEVLKDFLAMIVILKVGQIE